MDSALIRTLGWTTATRLRIQTCVDLIVVLADRHGVFRLGPPGYLRLPATARHWCGLRAGDRLLLAADPANSLLVVHPPAVLEEMVAGLHAARFREGAA
ncbi:AbrB/MazE/SpoVT family DNA-binding domain-containing protein [Dactylosporangium darangshiense]|uniref:AbrB/MazE/SpoVT family DNA-binding domain-containing protein n=1 Tax=Dactylosporangium darangshiense TaxID=579108 RepID=UPI00363235DF